MLCEFYLATKVRSFFRLQERDLALKCLGLKDSPFLTRDEVSEAFRFIAKRLHPDVPGGSKDAFQEAQAAHQMLCEILPSQEELLKMRQLEIDAREEERFALRHGDVKKQLGSAPRSILHKSSLKSRSNSGATSVAEKLLDSKLEALSYKTDHGLWGGEEGGGEGRAVEVTGKEVASVEELALEKEMEELKRSDLRVKGVSRMVDRMIGEALKRSDADMKQRGVNVSGDDVQKKTTTTAKVGVFEDVDGLKGKPLVADYYDTHLALGDQLERRLQRMLRDEGIVPEWVELQQQLDQHTQLLRREAQREVHRAKQALLSLSNDKTKNQTISQTGEKTAQPSSLSSVASFMAQALLEDEDTFVQQICQEQRVQDVVKTVAQTTKRYNMLCPPLLQRTSWTRQWLEELVRDVVREKA